MTTTTTAIQTAFSLSVGSDGTAHLIFDLPGEKVNTLSLPVLLELEKHLDAAAGNTQIKILAISSNKQDSFIAGANLHTFEEIFQDPVRVNEMISTGHRVFNKLAALPFPTVAMIHGACLGGGLELALACTYRIASDHAKTLIGLPEVSLGIIPGWGGTQRLPRLVGLVEGLTMIVSGRPVKAQRAFKIKLVDRLAASEFFEEQAKNFMQYSLTEKGKKELAERRRLSGFKHLLLEANPLGRSLVYSRAEKDVVKATKGRYPAPLVALNLIKKTYPLPLKDGLQEEVKTFVDNLSTGFAYAPNLIKLFFTQEALKKKGTVKGKEVKTAGVIGAGTMGATIAWLFSYKDIPVRMKDIDWNSIGKGWGATYALYQKMVKDKKLKQCEASLKFHTISGTIDYSGFEKLDLVIEAAVESLSIKQEILRELEKHVRPDAIIATNTSSLQLSDMAEVMDHPERLVGMHFFNPANRMPLVEVVASDKTTPEAIATAVAVCQKLGKTPFVVKDCPGFLVNRIFAIGFNEIAHMYQEGADFNRLEKMMVDFGMPMAGFVLADEIGNDVIYKVSKVFEKAYGPRMTMPKLLEVMDDHQLYGKKKGKGYYLYEGKTSKPNPEVETLRAGIKLNDKVFANEEMQDRVFLSMINESARCLEEKVIDNAAYLDMALLMGIGFPPFRGGTLRYADTLGINYVVKQLRNFQEKHGARFEPCALLVEMQKNNRTFY